MSQAFDLGDDAAFRFIGAYSQNAQHAVMGLPFAQAAEASDAMALSLNRAVIGEMTPAQALNQAAADLAGVLERNGYQLLRAYYGTDQCRYYVFKLEGGADVTLSMSSLRGLALQLNA